MNRRNMIIGVGALAAVSVVPNIAIASNHDKVLKWIDHRVRTALDATLFEYNDSFTRSVVKDYISHSLDSLVRDKSIVKYSVGCNEENNPAWLIDDNDLCVTVNVKHNDDFGTIRWYNVKQNLPVSYTYDRELNELMWKNT